jgi:hypothetical protein
MKMPRSSNKDILMCEIKIEISLLSTGFMGVNPRKTIRLIRVATSIEARKKCRMRRNSLRDIIWEVPMIIGNPSSDSFICKSLKA